MDWFEKLKGFREVSYEETRVQSEAADGKLRPRVNGTGFGFGELELVQLHDLRERVKSADGTVGGLKATAVRGDVRSMHRETESEAHYSRWPDCPGMELFRND
jgi:hypothetical protein